MFGFVLSLLVQSILRLLVNSCGLGDSDTTLNPRLAISSDPCSAAQSEQRHAVCSSLRARVHSTSQPVLLLLLLLLLPSLCHSHQDGSTLLEQLKSTSAVGKLGSHLGVRREQCGSSPPADEIPFTSAHQLGGRKPTWWQRPGCIRALSSCSASSPPQRAICLHSPTSPLREPGRQTGTVVGYYGLRAVGRRSTTSFASALRETRRAISQGAHTEVGVYPRDLRTLRLLALCAHC